MSHYLAKRKDIITQEIYDKLKKIALTYFLSYAKENEHDTDYDFSNIPIRIHTQNRENSYLVVIESPEEDVFYAPQNILYRDKAFIVIENEKVTTTNPYDGSAPMNHDTSSHNLKKMGIYPGSLYFQKPLAILRDSIIKNNIVINLNLFSDIDWVISNTEIVELFNKGGVFFEIAPHLIGMILYKRNLATNKQYRLQANYHLKKEKIENVLIDDTTPPPALC